jgi:hypothetical protein
LLVASRVARATLCEGATPLADPISDSISAIVRAQQIPFRGSSKEGSDNLQNTGNANNKRVYKKLSRVRARAKMDTGEPNCL